MAASRVPNIVLPPRTVHPHPTLTYQTNEPAGFCVHPSVYYALEGGDEPIIGTVPAPCLETRREIACREIRVLEEVVNRLEGTPVEAEPFSLSSTCFLREGCRLMAVRYLAQVQLLGLNHHQVTILQRAQAMGSTPEQRAVLRRWQDPRRCKQR